MVFNKIAAVCLDFILLGFRISDSIIFNPAYKTNHIQKCYYLIREEFSVVLGREVGLGRLRRVELQTFSNSLSQDVQGRIGLHDLGQGLLNQRLSTGEPVAKGRVQVVSLMKIIETYLFQNMQVTGGWHLHQLI